ncbi:MAG: site-specific integrase, partial [Pseudomonadota bacterium]
MAVPGDVRLKHDAPEELLRQWIAHLTGVRDASPKTIESYRFAVADYLGFLMRYHGAPPSLKTLATVSRPDVRAWLADIRNNRGLAARSTKQQLSALKTFYRWLDETHGVDPSVVLNAR